MIIVPLLQGGTEGDSCLNHQANLTPKKNVQPKLCQTMHLLQQSLCQLWPTATERIKDLKKSAPDRTNKKHTSWAQKKHEEGVRIIPATQYKDIFFGATQPMSLHL